MLVRSRTHEITIAGRAGVATAWLPLSAEMPVRLTGLAAGFEPSIAFPAHQQTSRCGRYRIGTAPFQGNDPG